MSWAAQHRFHVLLVLGISCIGFFSLVLVATLYKTPSCTDHIQNQNEEGVDCGGSCTYLCTAQMQPPTTLFTKAITNSSGRTDVVALVENKNAAAGAKNVQYHLSVYGTDRVLLHEERGVIDLPPNALVPVYVAGAVSGKQKVGNAFLTIDPVVVQWFSIAEDPRIVPTVSNIKEGGSVSAPRIQATLSNTGVVALRAVETVVVVRDARGEVVGTSKTIIPVIPAQGGATATFTWNDAFSGIPASIEVTPIIPLP